MAIVQGGNVAVPLKSISGVVTAPTTPVFCDTGIANAVTQVRIRLTADYTMQDDGGALSRVSTDAVLSSSTYPLTIYASACMFISLAEAKGLMAAGAATYA